MTSTQKAIAANIDNLQEMLQEMANKVSLANAAMQSKDQSQAIGWILDLDEQFKDVEDTYELILRAHRRKQ